MENNLLRKLNVNENIVITGTAEGEGLVGPRPRHFLRPRPHFLR